TDTALVSITITDVVDIAPTADTFTTTDTTPTLTGTGVPGETLTIEVDVDGDGTPEVTYTVVVDGSGNWSVDTTTATPDSGSLPVLNDGDMIEVTAINSSGVEGVGIVTIDINAPTVDTFTTADTTPTLTGTGVPGETLTIEVDVDGDGTPEVIYTVVVDGSGNWSIDTTTATPDSGNLPVLNDGDMIEVTAINSSGAEGVGIVTIQLSLTGTVEGTVYDDINGNGNQDTDEPGISNVEVIITDVNGGEQVVSTDANGLFTATVPAGETQVDIDNATLEIGRLQTQGTDPTTVTVIAGTNTFEENNGFTLIGDIDEEIVVYTGVTPNGDGVNDEFRIVGLENFPNNTLQIFNRWGVKVFEQDGYEQPGSEFFRGISNGRVTINKEKELPVGTYYYVLEYENADGIRKSKAGYLYINK
ncbi:gliding motility-associated C-terminal domain-containing protein, partial [Aquimarina sp. D1M17]|uniref:T9SS type B sorting domain-containing protein n=1 Tax=Aquimarina acroporae TaxID=2937283 RepID=UPI0020C0D508